MTRTTVTKTRKATTRPTQRVRSVVEAPPEGERGGCAGGRGVTVSVPYSTIELSPALHMPPEQGCVARSLPPAQYLPPFVVVVLQCRLHPVSSARLQQPGPQER